jgi:hypothetical protein
LTHVPTAPTVLGNIPSGLRDPLIDAFNKIVKNFREQRWEPAELNGGKLCEIAYSIVDGYTRGTFAAKPSKPANMVDACRALENADPSRFPRSIRVQIPRVLVALYEVRNNRGVGHTGGDVSANHMDALLVIEMAKWLMAELIRVFHNTDTVTATKAVESVTERTTPLVWSVGTKYRVLNPSLSMKDRTLVVLYAHDGPIQAVELRESVEHSNSSVYRRDVLRPLHAAKLIEYDEATGLVSISPLGIRYVEESIPHDVLVPRSTSRGSRRKDRRARPARKATSH